MSERTEASSSITRLLAEQTPQLLSAAGLAVLFGAVLSAVTSAIVSPAGLLLAGLPLLCAGVAIAWLRLWRAPAFVGLAGSLVLLLAATAVDAPAPLLPVGLGIVLLGAAICGLRPGWGVIAAGTVAMGGALASSWLSSGALAGPRLVLVAVGLWLCGAIVAVAERAHARPTSSAVTAIAGGLASFGVALAGLGVSAPLLVVAGLASIGQGLLLSHVARKRTVADNALVGVGIALSSVACALELGVMGLIVGIGLCSALALAGDHRQARWRLVAAMIGVGCELFLLGTSHPLISAGPPGQWHEWSVLSFVVAAQALWMWWRARGGSDAIDELARGALMLVQSLCVLASLSTLVALHIHWIPALDLLWTGAALGLWWGGRRHPPLRVAAAVALSAAALKLVVFDWAQIEGTTRVAMLVLIGGALTAGPLVLDRAPTPAASAAAKQPPGASGH
jgi:hypothetical protein